jgi:hypothetical protein
MEQDFDWAKRYLESLGYTIEETLATAKLSVFKDEDLADTAILKDDGSVLVTFRVKTPEGYVKVLKPPQIVVIAQSCYDLYGDILE